MLDSIQQLPDVYRGALLDQFGVLHDGVEPYPGAIEAVANWHARGMRLLIISNSSRREYAPASTTTPPLRLSPTNQHVASHHQAVFLLQVPLGR